MIDRQLLIEEVANMYGITPEQIRSASREKRIADARKMICLVMKDEPVREVAALINRSRDVARLHRINMEADMEVYPEIRQRYDYLINKTSTTMTIKTTPKGLTSISECIQMFLGAENDNPVAELIRMHMEELDEKIRKRLKAGKTSLGMEAKQAQAFTVFYLNFSEYFYSHHHHGWLIMEDIVHNQIKYGKTQAETGR